jgi:hypothetical protein
MYIYLLSQIYNTSLTSTYFGPNSRVIMCLGNLLLFNMLFNTLRSSMAPRSHADGHDGHAIAEPKQRSQSSVIG